MIVRAYLMRFVTFALWCYFGELITAQQPIAHESFVDFETVTVGKPVASWSANGVTITPAHGPKKSKAIGRISFFPHLGTGRKGVVNAMANEPIPIRVTFSKAASQVKLVLWGSTTSSALVEAFDSEGKLLVKESLEKVPVRKKPEEQIPFFEIEVSTTGIAYLDISGSQPGGYLAVDELRWSSSDFPHPKN